MAPISAVAGAFADDEMQQSRAGYNAMFLALKLKPATAARILDDENKGLWYARSPDGPAALEVKRVLHSGPVKQRAEVRKILTAIAKPGDHHARVPLE